MGHPTAAFTLIELLVVVAIIAILAAMILPALNRAKQESYVAGCKSNLHQLGLALQLYTGDFGAYPLSNSGYGGPLQPDIFWYATLAPYAHAKWTAKLGEGIADSTSQVFLCPAYPQSVGPFPSWDPILDGLFFGSYGYNTSGIGAFPTNEPLGLGGPINTPWNGPPAKSADIVSASHMIAIADAEFYSITNAPGPVAGYHDLDFISGVYLWCVPWGAPGTTAWPNCYAAEKARHSAGRRNVLFCDGHVEFLQPLQLYDYMSPAVLSLWNMDNQPHQNLLHTFP
jgi:prepilin-type processing-associated H-X9-DG protein/prepilin-type N-terminal cleavage/methylation domain-containing protein